jgi:hypothetical protein
MFFYPLENDIDAAGLCRSSPTLAIAGRESSAASDDQSKESRAFCAAFCLLVQLG